MGLSRQSVHQMLQRRGANFERSRQFIEKAEILRETHPEMGCRKMALILKEPGYGRDKTEELLLAGGFRVYYPPNFVKTTHSVRTNRFDNLIEGLTIRNINKVVQTDITYLWIKDRFYYLVFIIDVYSRLITGYHASCGLEAGANIKALQMMIRLRKKEKLKGLIHHSDRGIQYCSNEYVQLLQKSNALISMTQSGDPLENAIAERVNGILKTELISASYSNIHNASLSITKAIGIYNYKRRHSSINMQIPNEAHQQKGPQIKRWKNYWYSRKKNEEIVQPT